MFELKEINENGLKQWRMIHKENGAYISVVPEFGANINALVLNDHGKLYSVLNGNLNSAGFKEQGIYNGAHLIPFPNRLKEGRYTFGTDLRELPQNYSKENNAAHGFIYNKSFSLDDFQSFNKKATITFSYEYDGDMSGYPYPVRIQFFIMLDQKHGFSCRTRITNLSDSAIPMASGWHPYFTLQKPVDQLWLHFSAEYKIEVDDRMIPTGEKSEFDLFNTLTAIKDQELDTCFKILPNYKGIHKTVLSDPEQQIDIVFWQQTGERAYNYLQVYTPPKRDCLAIEPMTCNIDAFNNKEGLIILEGGDSFDASFGIELQ